MKKGLPRGSRVRSAPALLADSASVP